MSLAGSRALLLFHLRRDRMLLLWWLLGAVVFYWSQAASVRSLYPTQADFDAAARSMAGNAAFIAMAGPARALNTVGGQVAWQCVAFGAILAGLMSMFIVGRHTRAEEESGRDELVRAGAISRDAPLAAASLAVLVADLLFGGLVAAGLIAYGLPVAGSLNIGLAGALAGLVFAAVALVAAQLTDGTRAMYGVTGAAIAASYVLRAVGDVSNPAFSWASPIGWGQAMHSYSGDRWWPALVSVGAVVPLYAVALRLYARRDIGSGIWPPRPGPGEAGPTLQGSLGLVWRLQRWSIAGWAGGLFLTGLAYGAIGDDVKALLGDSTLSRDVLTQGGGSLVESFYAVAALMLALIGAGFSISSSLRPGDEEAGGQAEMLLATALSRQRWAWAHVAVTVGGTTAVVAAAGLGLGTGYGLVTGDGSTAARLFLATVPYVAPVLVLVAATWLAYGLARRWAVAGWPALGFCVVVMFFGRALRFPAWVTDISPFSHLALAPAQAFAWAPFVAVLLVAALGSAAGVAMLNRRDLS